MPARVAGVAEEDWVLGERNWVVAGLARDASNALSLCGFEVARGVFSEPVVAAAETGSGGTLLVGDVWVG